MLHATLAAPDLDTFCQLDRLGLTAVGEKIEAQCSVLECRLRADDDWCRQCGQQGVPQGTFRRRLAHVPMGWHPTPLHEKVRRYRYPDCAIVWRQDTSTAAEPRAKLSRHAALWALRAVVIDRLSIKRVTAGLGLAWNTANDAVLAAGHRLLINDPARLEGCRSSASMSTCGPTPATGRSTSPDHRLDADPRRHRALAAARHDPGPVEAGLQTLAGGSLDGVPRRDSRSWPWTASPATRPPPKKSPRRPR